MPKLTENMIKVIRYGQRYSRQVACNVHGATLASLLKNGYVELYHQTKPFFYAGYRLTDKGFNCL